MKNNNSFKIYKFTESDVKRSTDHWILFENLILSHEELYPQIQSWLENKVKPGLKHGNRIAFIGYYEETPIATAIVKKGVKSKICHLSINESFQNIKLGDLFFAMMALEIKGFAKELHFTLPESLWEEKKKFFESYGFESAIKSQIQYRLFEEEFRCSAPFLNVWSSVVHKLPKILENFQIDTNQRENSLLISIKPDYAEKIFHKKKTVEIRKKFSQKWIGHKAAVYASHPISGVIGDVKIENVIQDSPENIWNMYENEIGCTKEQFNNYIGCVDYIYAIQLSEINAYSQVLTLKDMTGISRTKLSPPQTYTYLEAENNWNTAISIINWLDNSIITSKE